MNQERFNHFWLYVIDMHNHHSVGDLRYNQTFCQYFIHYIYFADMLSIPQAHSGWSSYWRLC